MATRAPRTSIEAVPQLATVPERVAVVETQVKAMDEKIDDLKADVKDVHDCLDRTRDGIMDELKSMQDAYWENANKYYTHSDEHHKMLLEQHEEINDKIKDLEGFKNKGLMYFVGLLAFMAGAGWIHKDHIELIMKLLGL
jgi:chromosome segregation ATPase